MPKYAKGLELDVTDRDEFEEFVKENAHDPGLHYDSWGENAVPKAIYVVSYRDEEDEPYYRCLNKHVNGVVTTHYYDEGFLKQARGSVLSEAGYDVEFVEENA